MCKDDSHTVSIDAGYMWKRTTTPSSLIIGRPQEPFFFVAAISNHVYEVQNLDQRLNVLFKSDIMDIHINK